jgi:hypothetical protein
VPSDSQWLVLFALTMGVILAWLLCVSLVLWRLRSRHPQAYAAMGSPRMSHSPIGLGVRQNLALQSKMLGDGWTVLRFVFGRRHRSLQDTTLSWLSDVGLVTFALGAAGFVTLWIFGWST